MAVVKKAIDTKRLQSVVNDFTKLYNVDISTKSAQADKRKAEKTLVEEIKAMINLYEY